VVGGMHQKNNVKRKAMVVGANQERNIGGQWQPIIIATRKKFLIEYASGMK